MEATSTTLDTTRNNVKTRTESWAPDGFLVALSELPQTNALEDLMWNLPDDDQEAIHADVEARWQPYISKFTSPRVGRLASEDEDDRLAGFDERKRSAWWDSLSKMSSAQFLREGYGPGEFAYEVGQGRLSAEDAIEAFVECGASRDQARAEVEALFDWKNLLADVLFGEEVGWAHQKQLERQAAARRLNKNPGPTGWGPINLGRYVRGEVVDQPPTRLPRVDGMCLLYPSNCIGSAGNRRG